MENQLFESLEGFKNLSLEAKSNIRGSASSSVDQNQPLDIEFVENILNYEFKDKSLLLQAFTDSSYDDENCVNSYERLEFIGDTVLNFMVSEEFYRYSNSTPGEMTNLRAVNVDTEKLARIALKHNLHLCLRHNKLFLDDQVLTFSKEIENYPLHSRGLLKVPKVLADIVESTIGALYLDCNSTMTVWKVIKPLLEPIITSEKYVSHPMTQLYEMCQKKNLKLRIHDNTWEDDRNVFVCIEDRLVGHGHHLVKKDSARNCAAKNAIDNFSYFSF